MKSPKNLRAHVLKEHLFVDSAYAKVARDHVKAEKLGTISERQV